MTSVGACGTGLSAASAAGTGTVGAGEAFSGEPGNGRLRAASKPDIGFDSARGDITEGTGLITDGVGGKVGAVGVGARKGRGETTGEDPSNEATGEGALRHGAGLAAAGAV